MAKETPKLQGLQALAQIIGSTSQGRRALAIMDEDTLPFRESPAKKRVAINNWLRKGFVGAGADFVWLKAVYGFPQQYVVNFAQDKGFTVISHYFTRSAPLLVKCNRCRRVFVSSFDSIQKNTTGGCIKCYKKLTKDYYTYEKVVRKLKKYGFKLMVKKSEYRGVRDYTDLSDRGYAKDIHYPIQCQSCQRVYLSVLRTRMSGIGCRYCGAFYGHSIAEKELEKIIRVNFPQLTLHVGYRQLIPPYEVDFYLPDLKLAFEYNGIYWHNDDNIKKRTRGKHTTADSYHKMKTDLCRDAGITLIHLSEADGKYNKVDLIYTIQSHLQGARL